MALQLHSLKNSQLPSGYQEVDASFCLFKSESTEEGRGDKEERSRGGRREGGGGDSY